MVRRSFAFCAFLSLAVLAPVSIHSAERISWRTAPEVRQELDGFIRLTWPSNPLRDSLSNLARVRRVAIWLDRRIDPDQRIELQTDEAPLRDALSQLAEQLNARVCLVGPVVYIGPRPSGSKLLAQSALRREEAAKLSGDLRRKLSATKAWQWEELSEPRELVNQLAAEAGLKPSGLEQIPHDLWPAGDWPPLSLSDRLSLVLAGFDLTFEITPGGGALKLVPYPTSTAAVERTHAVKGDVKQAVEKLAPMFPTAVIRPSVGKITVTATADEHEQIVEILKGAPPKRPPPGAEKRHTLKIDNKPVGGVAKALAERLELDLKFDESIQADQLNQLVSFQVKEVTLDRLFEALLEPTGLAHKIDGKKLEVFPKGKK